MPLKITKSSERIDVKTIKVMLYGQPGVGKTSIAFTAHNVLMLDCDRGAYRSHFRKDIVEVDNWQNIASITQADLDGYDTVVVDTVGRLLDFLAADIISSNPKMGFNGALTLQGYGQLKSLFASWTKRLTTLGKDVVMIAHDKEDKRGDEVAIRPDIQGGSYGEVFKIADAVGYMYRGEKGNVLDFNPTTRYEGKNVAALDPIQIPDFKREPEFFADVLTNIKESMNQLSVEGKMIADIVANERQAISEITTAEGMNEAIERCYGLMDAAQPPVKRLIKERGDSLGLEYSKEQSKYVEPEAEGAKQ